MKEDVLETELDYIFGFLRVLCDVGIVHLGRDTVVTPDWPGLAFDRVGAQVLLVRDEAGNLGFLTVFIAEIKLLCEEDELTQRGQVDSFGVHPIGSHPGHEPGPYCLEIPMRCLRVLRVVGTLF
jgi:hypothetical protein